MSVRFLGRRVYLGLAVVLMSERRAALTSTAARLCQGLQIPWRTLARWRSWWVQSFPLTPTWASQCARFMPPVSTADLPASLSERFASLAQTGEQAIGNVLRFLKPLSVRASVTLIEACA